MTDFNIDDRLSSLQAELETYSGDILNYISILYSPTQGNIDLKSDPRNMLKVLDSF